MSDTQPNQTAPKKTSLIQLLKDVRAEARKVTWATKGETITSSIMVFVMAVIAAALFYLADVVIKFGVGAIINFATGLAK